jgi:hypothetical protein
MGAVECGQSSLLSALSCWVCWQRKVVVPGGLPKKLRGNRSGLGWVGVVGVGLLWDFSGFVLCVCVCAFYWVVHHKIKLRQL